MTLTVSSNPMEQIEQTSNALVKEMPSLKALGKDLAAQEAAVEKQLAAVRKEAEKVKGGEDRVEEIIAAKMRDMNVASVGAIKIPEHCIVNSRAHMSKYCKEKNLIGDYDGAFFRNLPSQSEFKKVRALLVDANPKPHPNPNPNPSPNPSPSPHPNQVHALLVDEKWQMLLLSGVAAHVPLEPALNPQGDTSYTNYVAEQMEKGALAVCGVTKVRARARVRVRVS